MAPEQEAGGGSPLSQPCPEASCWQSRERGWGGSGWGTLGTHPRCAPGDCTEYREAGGLPAAPSPPTRQGRELRVTSQLGHGGVQKVWGLRRGQSWDMAPGRMDRGRESPGPRERLAGACGQGATGQGRTGLAFTHRWIHEKV